MKILQFIYALPPHIGGLEQIVQQFSDSFVEKGYGEIINVTSSLGQEKITKDIIYRGSHIGYNRNGVKILIIPSFELIKNFPFPKLWKKDFWIIIKYIRKLKSDIIQIHMRFFIFSLLGWFLAKIWKKPIVLVEHSSNFIKFSKSRKTFIGRIYDCFVSFLLYRTADIIIPTSRISKDFIQKFTNKPMEVIYRGIDKKDIISSGNKILKNKFPNRIIIGVVGRLVYRKNIHSLINSYYKLDKSIQNKIKICIIGGGEEYDNLKSLDIENKIYFTGEVSFQEAINYQSDFDIYIHPSSHGGALAGTLLQAMYLGNLIIATPYEGAKEVIIDSDNGVLLQDDSVGEIIRGIEKGLKLINKKDIWAKKNKKIIDEKFDWDEKLKEFYNVYESLFYSNFKCSKTYLKKIKN